MDMPIIAKWNPAKHLPRQHACIVAAPLSVLVSQYLLIDVSGVPLLTEQEQQLEIGQRIAVSPYEVSGHLTHT